MSTAEQTPNSLREQGWTGQAKIDAQNPWPGPDAYDEASRAFFHGRVFEAEELLRLIRLASLTVLYGKSGLGKTSVLQAGLFPLLRTQHYFPVLLRIDFAEATKVSPLEQVKEHLKASFDSEGVEYPLIETQESLWEYLHRKDAIFWSADNFPLFPVLVFDQFEELFSRSGGNVELIRQVFNELADLIENRIPPELASETAGQKRARLDLLSQHYRVVLSFREDFLPEVRTWEKQVPSLLRNYLRLEPMSRTCAIEAVERGGKEVLDVAVAPYIVDLVGKCDLQTGVGDTADIVIEPVLLSLCCTQLNLRRAPDAKIDKTLVETAGQDILESFYRDALEDPHVKGEPDVAHFIQTYLIQGDHFRGDYPKEEALHENKLRSQQLTALTDRIRLLRIVHRSDTARIELIHDRLVPVVRKARDQRSIQALQDEQKRQARQAQILQRQRDKAVWTLCVAIVAAVLCGILAIWAVYEKGQANHAKRDAIAQKDQALKAEDRAKQAQRNQDMVAKKAIVAEKSAELANARQAKSEQQARNEEQQAKSEQQRAERLKRDIAFGWDTARMGEGRLAFDPGEEPFEEMAYRTLAAYRLSSFDEGLSQARTESLSALEILLDSSPHLSKIVKIQGLTPTPALAFSPDGKTLAVGGEDGLIRLLDAGNYHQVGVLDCLQKHAESAWSLAFSPDGGRLVAGYAKNSGDGSGLVCIFDMQQRSIFRKWSNMDHGHGSANVYSVAYGGRAEHEFVIFGGNDKILRKLDVSTGNVLEAPNKTAVVAVDISADGSRIATGGDDGTLRVWKLADFSNPKSQPTELKGHEATIEQVVFSRSNPDILVSAGDDGRIFAWNVKGAGCPTEESKLQDARIDGIALNPDGFVASAGADGFVRMFLPSKTKEACSTTKIPPEMQEVREGVLSGHGGMTLGVAFTRNGLKLASTGQDGSIHIWVPNTGSFSVAQLMLASTSDSGTGNNVSSGSVTAVGISPDDKLIAAGDDKGNIYVWNRPEESSEAIVQSAAMSWKAHKTAIRCLLYVRIHNQWAIVTGGDDGVLKRWDPASWKIIGGELADGAQSVRSLALSPDGKMLAAGSVDGTVRLWGAIDGGLAQTISPPKATDYKLSSVGFSDDGRYLAIGSNYLSLRVIDLENGNKEEQIDVTNAGTSAISHSKQAWLLSSGSDGSVLEWEKKALGQPEPDTIRKRDEFKYRMGSYGSRNQEAITSMDASRDGTLILTGGKHGHIQLWDDVKHVLISDHFAGHTREITAVALASDGRFFATADNSQILVWPGPDRWADILCSKLVLNISHEYWNKWISPEMPYTEQCPGLPVESDDASTAKN